MPIRVRGPGGATVNFPDGTSQEEIQRAMAAQFSTPAQQEAGSNADSWESKAQTLYEGLKLAPGMLGFIGQAGSGLGQGGRRALGQGFTFGFGDELSGVVARAGSALRHPERTRTENREAGRAAVETQRGRQEQFAQEHPVGNVAIQGIGGGLNPVSWLGGGEVLAGRGLGSLAARGAAMGGAFGAVSGAGNASGGLGERTKGAIGGGLFGAALGAAIPFGAEGVRRTVGGVGEALGRTGTLLGVEPILRGAGERMGIARPGVPALSSGAQQKALQQVASRAGPDAIPTLQNNAIEAMGKPITAAEAIGRPAMTDLLAIGRRPGSTPDQLEGLLASRSEGQGARLVDDLGESAGIDPALIDGDFRTAAAEMRTKAGPLYDEAYAHPPVQSAELEALMNTRPSLQTAMRNAVKIAREEGRDPAALGFDFNEAGDVTHVKTPSMQTLDYLKRGLDDVLDGYRDSTTRRLNLNGEGRAVQGTLAEFRSHLTNPDTARGQAYAAALKAGGDPIRLEQAYRDAPKLMSSRVSEREFFQRGKAMSTGERQALVAGYANDLFERARAGKLKLREFATPAVRTKLAKLLGQDSADKFIERVGAEATLAKGGRMSPGTGSVTAEALMADQDLSRNMNLFGRLTRGAASGKPVQGLLTEAALSAMSPIEGALRGFQAPQNQAVRNEMGRLLMLPPSRLAGELSKLKTATRPRGLLDYAPAQAGAFGGRSAAN